MTMTKELEQAARDWRTTAHLAWTEPDDGKVWMTRDAVAFALTRLRQQLADLERRGYAGHTKVCNASIAPDHYAGKQVGECDCGWDEMKRELEQQ